MGIFVGIGNYIGRQPIGPTDYYIITEDRIAVLTERGKHILLDEYVTEDEIATWVKEHMVFWYDMSKPVDVYVPGVTYANLFINTGGKLTYDNTINKCTITHTPTNNKDVSFWQIIAKPLQYVESYKIRVTGLPTGFTIKGRLGYDIQITSDGEYDIPEYKNSSTKNSYPGFYLAGDNVNDVDCNIVVEEIPIRQSVPTNEILKANPYLQDHSGNNRPLKLNNFLFAGMGGYTLNAKSYHNRSNSIVGTFGDYFIEITAKVTDILGIVWTKNGIGDSNSVAKGETLTRPAFTITVEGMPDDLKWGMYESGGANKGNGIFEIPAYTYTNNTETVQTKFIGLTFNQSTFDNVDIKFTFQPLYPNALVTDGQVQNLSQGVKMLFMTANPLGLYKTWYAQDSFSIYGQPGITAYNFRNTGGVTYLDGILNEAEVSNNLLNKKQTVTIVNPTDGGNNSIIFFNSYGSSYMNMAFYNSIGFDAVPEDNGTLQRVINYVINNILNKA